jgi:lactoylglutathione lyase
MATEANVLEAVPFFGVSDMDASLRFYIDGLGFELTKKWIVKGKIRWCWLQLGGGAIMLQEFLKTKVLDGKPGQGVSICFQCRDALMLYRELKARGVQANNPFVGNQMWVTSVTDPDGYKLDFESPTDAPEESEYVEPPTAQQ